MSLKYKFTADTAGAAVIISFFTARRRGSKFHSGSDRPYLTSAISAQIGNLLTLPAAVFTAGAVSPDSCAIRAFPASAARIARINRSLFSDFSVSEHVRKMLFVSREVRFFLPRSAALQKPVPPALCRYKWTDPSAPCRLLSPRRRIRKLSEETAPDF